VAASRAAQQEEDLQASASGAEELDEFGRDVNMMKRQEAAERRQRRMQRLQQQASKQTDSQVLSQTVHVFAGGNIELFNVRKRESPEGF